MNDSTQNLPESAPVSVRTRSDGQTEHHELVVEPVTDAAGLWARFAPEDAGGPVLLLDVESVRALIAACASLPWIAHKPASRFAAHQACTSDHA